MTTHFTELAQRAATDGVIDPQELLGLRQQGWGDGIITREEAEAIFAVNNVLNERDQAWTDFFVEAIGEYVLNGTQPRRQCSETEAQWLIAQVDADGVLESYTELEALVSIVERAENVPDSLKNYLIEQVEREVRTGTGPTRDGGELSDTHITSAECKILRRVIFASGGFGPAAVSRFDAEALFRIKDATLADSNASEWGDLFVDGVANYLRGFALGNAQLSHSRKLELVKFVEDTRPNHGRFLSQMANSTKSFGRNMRWAMEELQSESGIRTDFGAEAAAGDLVTQNEKDWLDAQVQSDGQVDALEQRLLRRLAEQD